MGFVSASCHPNGSVQLVHTVPLMALKALCTAEFSMDQLQNLVGRVHAWSQCAAWFILSVSIMQILFEFEQCCEGRVCQQHSFLPVLKSGHRRAVPLSANGFSVGSDGV